jgi:sucrose-6F-phosphate phosphohydrolase
VARPRVLISDLDGTLVGDAAALERFAAWHATRGRGSRLVYATGRSAASVAELIATTPLPEPDALISDVGTAIRGPGEAPWSDWPPPLERWQAGVVVEVLADEPGVVLQPDAAQSDVKVSHYAGVLRHRDLLRIGRALRARGVHGRLVHSAGRYLDVLPHATGKRAAARHVLRRWGIDVRDVVTAGDSGNDRDLLRLGGYGIVVGNASDELRTLRGARILHVVGSHADGVLEGLRRIDEMSPSAMPPRGAASAAGMSAPSAIGRGAR